MDESKHGLYMVAIVGIIAVVGIVVMIIGANGASRFASADSAGQAFNFEGTTIKGCNSQEDCGKDVCVFYITQAAKTKAGYEGYCQKAAAYD